MKKRLAVWLSAVTLLAAILALPAQAAITSDPLSWFVREGTSGRGSKFQYNEAEGTLYCIADKGGSLMSPDYVDGKGDTMLDSNMLLRTKNGITAPPAQGEVQDFYMTDFGWSFDYTTLKNEWIQDRAMFRSRQENEWDSYMLMMIGSSVSEKVEPGLGLYAGGIFDKPLAHVDFTFEIGVTYRVKIQMIENNVKVWFYKAGTAMPSVPTLQATIDTAQNYVPSGDFQWQSWAGNTVLSNMEIGAPSIVNKADPTPKKLSIPGMSTDTPNTTVTTENRVDSATTVSVQNGDSTAASDVSENTTVSESPAQTSGGTATATNAPSAAITTTKATQADTNPNAALPIVLVICGVLIMGGAVAAALILRKAGKKPTDTTES